MDGRTNRDRVLTLPNAFTLVRLACVPVFVYLLLVHDPQLKYQAAALLAALGCTDWVDGYLARHLDQVSALGKILDPVADRVLLLVGVAAIVYDGDAPAWVAAVALTREALVATATVVLAVLGAKRLDVSWWGKAGTFGLMVAFPLFLTSHSTAGWRQLAGHLAWIAAIPGLAFGLYALAGYLPQARSALAEGRAGRAAAATATATSPVEAR